MEGSGILDGDIAIIHKQSTAENGEIVAAMLEDEATLKYFFKKDREIRLVAANRAFKDIVTTEVQILGKLISISRTMN